MPRVTFVKSAQKDNPVAKKGEPYYWWKFRFGGKRYSTTYPKRSQLTQSGFLSELYELQDNWGDQVDSSDLEGTVSSLVEQINAMREQCEESLENMPEQLRDADSGQTLQERIDGLQEWADELEGIDLEIDEDLTEDEQEERREEIADEIRNCTGSL